MNGYEQHAYPLSNAHHRELLEEAHRLHQGAEALRATRRAKANARQRAARAATAASGLGPSAGPRRAARPLWLVANKAGHALVAVGRRLESLAG